LIKKAFEDSGTKGEANSTDRFMEHKIVVWRNRKHGGREKTWRTITSNFLE